MPAPMTDADRQLEREARVYQRRVNDRIGAFRQRLFRLPPIEAMSILGALTIEAFASLEPQDRMRACDAWADNIRGAVRDSLG